MRFLSEVINITDTYDTINCKHFNLDYEVAIEEVLYSNNNIVLGDKIVIKNTWENRQDVLMIGLVLIILQGRQTLGLTKKNDKRLFAINLNESKDYLPYTNYRAEYLINIKINTAKQDLSAIIF